MKLNLTRPIVFFDLETTGLSISKDRIIQLSYIKVLPDGTETRHEQMLNPQQPIPEEVETLTGITDEMVKGMPTFKDIAPKLAEEFAGCDFAGYNSNRFDFPLLVEEFYRAQVPFNYREARLIDVQNIYHKMERRNLAAAYKFYCGRKME
ncbi:MAG: 3'-5' exonuclease, partial [Bacteroidaceae bacterium]|nr:3'-5' exonuclease [Bacteroidaceae bacterium]